MKQNDRSLKESQEVAQKKSPTPFFSPSVRINRNLIDIEPESWLESNSKNPDDIDIHDDDDDDDNDDDDDGDDDDGDDADVDINDHSKVLQRKEQQRDVSGGVFFWLND